MGGKAQSCAMQTTLHRRQREREQVGALFAGETFDLAQPENLAVRRVERRQGLADRCPIGVRGRRIRRVRFSPAGGQAERLERDEILGLARPAPELAVQGVAGDGEQPGARRVAAAKSAGALPGSEKGLLQGVFDGRRIRRQKTQIAERRPLVPLYEARVSGGVARGGCREQRRIAQRFATGHVLMPRIEYSGQLPRSPVARGTSPRRPQ